jgi:hypothetical protein
MKKVAFTIILMIWSMHVIATTENASLIKKVQSLPDLTAQITNYDMPSVLLTSPTDGRIDKFASSQNQAFIVRSQSSANFIAVVNPKISNGFLWWKKAVRLVFLKERWMKLENGTEELTPEETHFMQEL